MTIPSTMEHRPIALVSTLHDPDGIYLSALEQRRTALAWYKSVYVCATETTHERLIADLRALGVTVMLRPERDPGSGRRLSIELAINDGHPAIQYCDFDRWLHWAGRFPRELDELPAKIDRIRPRPWYVCFGRTSRALATHPEVQRVAERATCRALELVIGRRIDATAGSCWLSAEGAEIVVNRSVERTMGTDLEWPALIWQQDPTRLRMIRTEGLEFETTEYATAAIAAAGGEEVWLRQTYQQPEMWRARLQLAADSIAALDRVIRSPSTPESQRATPDVYASLVSAGLRR